MECKNTMAGIYWRLVESYCFYRYVVYVRDKENVQGHSSRSRGYATFKEEIKNVFKMSLSVINLLA